MKISILFNCIQDTMPQKPLENVKAIKGDLYKVTGKKKMKNGSAWQKIYRVLQKGFLQTF